MLTYYLKMQSIIWKSQSSLINYAQCLAHTGLHKVEWGPPANWFNKIRKQNNEHQLA